MRIFVNGESRSVDSATLAAALDTLGFAGRKIATAVNGRFVPAAQRQATRLSDGDKVEVVAPMQGG